MGMYEQDEQVATEGACDGLDGRQSDAADVQPSIQSEKVHATSTLCLSGSQNVSEDRLSRSGGPSLQTAPTCAKRSSWRGAALHDISEGGSAAVAFQAGRSAAGRNGPPMMGRRRRVPLAAIDSTGLESRHTSRYFIHRRSRTPNLWQTTQYTRYPKLGLLVDCSNHFILGYLTDQGPKPDIRDLEPTLANTTASRSDRVADGRRRLRQRIEPSTVPRRTWHSIADSSEARSADDQARQAAATAV